MKARYQEGVFKPLEKIKDIKEGEVVEIVLEKEEVLLRAKKLYGASKRKTTDAQLHRAGEKAFQEIYKELK